MKNDNAKRGREALQGVLQSLEKVERCKIRITFVWVPAHTGIVGNEYAHKAAQSTTEPGKKPSKNPINRIREGYAVQKLINEDLAEQKRLRAQGRKHGSWG